MNAIEMTDEENFIRKVESIYEVIDDFVHWCVDIVEFWHNDRNPEPELIEEKLEICKSNEYIKVLYEYDIYFLWLKFYNHFYIDNYTYQKSKIIQSSLKCCSRKIAHLKWEMANEYRKITALKIFKQVYCVCCKKEIENRNKRYAMNILFYKKNLTF